MQGEEIVFPGKRNALGLRKSFAKDAVLAVGDEPTATGADMLIGKAMLLGFM